MNCTLSSAFVGYCIEYKKMHGMNNVKFVYVLYTLQSLNTGTFTVLPCLVKKCPVGKCTLMGIPTSIVFITWLSMAVMTHLEHGDRSHISNTAPLAHSWHQTENFTNHGLLACYGIRTLYTGLCKIMC